MNNKNKKKIFIAFHILNAFSFGKNFSSAVLTINAPSVTNIGIRLKRPIARLRKNSIKNKPTSQIIKEGI